MPTKWALLFESILIHFSGVSIKVLCFFLQDLSEQLDDEEENSAEMAETKKKMEGEIDDLKQDVEDLESALKKVWQLGY